MHTVGPLVLLLASMHTSSYMYYEYPYVRHNYLFLFDVDVDVRAYMVYVI